MAGFHTLLSRFHISAAMVLATVAYLAVPEAAFGDDPYKCAGDCETRYGTGNASYWGCVANCCNTDDPNDPYCCADLCSGADPGCIRGCAAYVPCQVDFDSKGKGIGCVNPGAACTYFGKPSSCETIVVGAQYSCNCPAVP
jgi:hypothetical protein